MESRVLAIGVQGKYSNADSDVKMVGSQFFRVISLTPYFSVVIPNTDVMYVKQTF